MSESDRLIYFYPGEKVKNHYDRKGPFHWVTVVRTARTRVLIKRECGKEVWAQNKDLSRPAEFPRDTDGNILPKR